MKPKLKLNNLKLNLETLTFRTFLRGFLVVGFFLLILIGIVIQHGPFKMRLGEGDIALKSIYAPYDFVYTGMIDEIKTQQERQKVKKAVKDIYLLNAQVFSDALTKSDNFFNRLSQARQEIAGLQDKKEQEDIRTQSKEKLQKIIAVSLQENSLNALLRAEDVFRLSGETQDALRSIYSQGILSNIDKKSLLDTGVKEVSVSDSASQAERTAEIEKIPSYDEAVRDVYNQTKKVVSDKKAVWAVSELLQNLVAPNLFFDSKLTEARRQEAANAVPVQYQQIEVKKGQIIVGKGQRVLKEHINQLVKIERIQSEEAKVKFLAGVVLLVFLLLLIVTIYLLLYEPKIFHNTSYLVLIGILSVTIIYIARAIIISPLPSYLIPLASVSMLLAVLLNPRMAIFMTVCLSIAIGINIENSLNTAITFLFGGMAGVFSVRNMRRRWHIIRSGVLVGITNCVSIITIGFLNNLNFDSFAPDSAWGFANGIICAFIVMGILPLLEDAFKLTTNITLLELSDMNHPLLKEMILKAPGTYNHSLMVGNLAEAASEAIGANSLLARVGAYYHDVGKIEKSEYFSENQTDAKSLHDKLTPSMSRLIITSHVKDGVELAKKHGLKNAILDFIEQHHGTGLVYYFFQKALERVEDDTILKEEGYRYPGPKPQTKETAIVLLADSVEAASRTLANPTPSRVEELAHRIINNKFIDGQLDECELTLKDLNKIAEVFIRILMGILHSRIEYPAENENQHS